MSLTLGKAVRSLSCELGHGNLSSSSHAHAHAHAHAQADVQARMVVGGVNVLEKYEEQERRLEESQAELGRIKADEAELVAKLKAKANEKFQLEEAYASVDEEIVGKTKKLKKVLVKEAMALGVLLTSLGPLVPLAVWQPSAGCK